MVGSRNRGRSRNDRGNFRDVKKRSVKEEFKKDLFKKIFYYWIMTIAEKCRYRKSQWSVLFFRDSAMKKFSSLKKSGLSNKGIRTAGFIAEISAIFPLTN